MAIRLLSGEDVRQAINMGDAIEAMKEAFIQLSSDNVVMPVRSVVDVPKNRGVTLIMPGFITTDDKLAVKMVSVFNENHLLGLPLIHALVVVIDATTGQPVAAMDGAKLTALRTGAASGAATDLLANEDGSCVAIVGAGVQGRTQLEAVFAVREIQEARVYDVDVEQAHRFASEMEEMLGLEIQVSESASAALHEADIICTATNSTTPVFQDEDVKQGAHINAVGAYTPQMQEIPPETVVRAKVVIDHEESSMAEAGDLIIPMAAGLFHKDDIYAELGDIASQSKPGRETSEEITLFKSVGIAVQDAAAANLVLNAAEELNLGIEFEL